MSFFDAVLLGIVEGITEFLPISSTGHLILATRLLGIPESDFVKSFHITIQLGAILAVIVLYGKSLLVNRKILSRVAVAFLPTAFLGFILYKVIKHVFLGSEQIVLWSLFLGGVFLILFERFYQKHGGTVGDLEKISYRQSFLIGVFQSLAVVPGVSRAAATIIGGLILGLKRKTIVEFSFLLAIPTMAAAAGYDLMKSAAVFSGGQFSVLLCGFFVSFVLAILGIKFFLHFIVRHDFTSFGVYRVLVALLFWFVIR